MIICMRLALVQHSITSIVYVIDVKDLWGAKKDTAVHVAILMFVKVVFDDNRINLRSHWLELYPVSV